MSIVSYLMFVLLLLISSISDSLGKLGMALRPPSCGSCIFITKLGFFDYVNLLDIIFLSVFFWLAFVTNKSNNFCKLIII